MIYTATSGFTPWANGNYWCKDQPSHSFLVEGENVTIRRVNGTQDFKSSKATWKYGDFGEAHPAVVEVTGENSYDVEITMWNGKLIIKGVLGDDGKRVTFWSWTKEVAAYQWMSEEELDMLKNSGDLADAPPSHHRIQPDNPGKFIFVSGPPGLGKSTTGHLLSKTAGYVYYEGDCFSYGVNPYLPPDVKDPSMDTVKQKPLKGLIQERLNAVTNGMKEFAAMGEGKEYDLKRFETFYIAMCADITQERKRLGGDWVIAQAVPFRSLRDVIRAELGPDLVFVVLNMSKEDQEKRITERHGERDDGNSINEFLKKLFDLYEPASDDEENAIDLMISSDMTREDVVDKILKLVN